MHHILVLTDHPDPRVLVLKFQGPAFNARREIKCIDALSLYERNARPAEFYNKCLVERKGRVAIISAYTGKLRIIELDSGYIKSNFDVAYVVEILES